MRRRGGWEQGRVRGATVVGLSDVGARCGASGLRGGGGKSSLRRETLQKQQQLSEAETREDGVTEREDISCQELLPSWSLVS